MMAYILGVQQLIYPYIAYAKNDDVKYVYLPLLKDIYEDDTHEQSL